MCRRLRLVSYCTFLALMLSGMLLLASCNWHEKPVSVCPPGSAATSTPETDKETLVALYNATDGPNWFGNGNWLSDVPVCEWNGVTTDTVGRVIELERQNQGISGEIPPELGNLANLERLSLGANQLSGEIPPELGNLANLEYLSLGANQLSGEIPPELGNIASLRSLHLGGDWPSGEIPPELGNLQLGGNQLSGKIPPELGNLASLEDLHLGGNRLSGEIPPELGNLAHLIRLRLYENRLSGEIPPELGNLTNLEWLYLQGNELSGCVPASQYSCIASPTSAACRSAPGPTLGTTGMPLSLSTTPLTAQIGRTTITG